MKKVYLLILFLLVNTAISIDQNTDRYAFHFAYLARTDGLYKEIPKKVVEYEDAAAVFRKTEFPNSLSWTKWQVGDYPITYHAYLRHWYEEGKYEAPQIEILGQHFRMDSLLYKNYGEYRNKSELCKCDLELSDIHEINLGDKKYLVVSLNDIHQSIAIYDWYLFLFDVTDEENITAFALTTQDNFANSEFGKPFCLNDFNEDGQLDFARWSFDGEQNEVRCYTIKGNELVKTVYFLKLENNYPNYPIIVEQSHWCFDLSETFGR